MAISLPTSMDGLNYATAYQRALEQAYPYALYFGKLYSTPNNGRFRWVNARTIEIPSIRTTGRVDADRDTIAGAARNYDNSWETKTLTNQRKWSTLVHPMDIDQTNLVASISNITKVFNEEHKFPEMDAYTISSIYSAWTTDIDASTGHRGYTGKTPDTTKLTTSNILSVFDKLMLAMDNKRVPVSGRVLYVTNEIKTMLKNAQDLQRNWDVQSSADMINRSVNRLDEVEIIPVPAELMRTAYDFTEGWAPLPVAAQVNMMLVLPTAVITPVSYNFSNLAAPSAVTEGKYLYYEESFEDVFILNNKADAIQFNVDFTPAPIEVKSEAGTTASGDTVITIPELGTGEYAYYMTAASVDIPDIGSEITTTDGWTALPSGGVVSSTTTDDDIVVVVCIKDDSKYYTTKAGKTKVVAKA